MRDVLAPEPEISHASSVQRPASSVQRPVLTAASLLAAVVVCQPAIAQEAVWRAGEPLPGLLGVRVRERSDADAVGEWLRELRLNVLGVNKVTGTLWVQCPVDEEWFWIAFAKHHHLIRSVSQDRGGRSAFTVPPSEMPQPTGEPPSTWDLHDLWYLQNTGQQITSGNAGAGTQTGTPSSDLDLLNAWTITQGDPDIRLAIFDTGVDYEHPEFDGRLHPTGISWVCGPGLYAHHCCTGTPVVCNWGEPTDNDGHGTSVASVAAANVDNGTPSSTDETQYAGVDPGCTIFPVRVSRHNIPSQEATNLALADIVDSDDPELVVHVINISYAFPRDDEDDAQIEMKALLDICRSMGIVVVVASMNDGPGTAEDNVPAAWDNVITVAATDMNDNDPPFSGTGPSVDFAAPGWGMYAAYCPASRGCDPNYGTNYLNGTSASTPGVAGVTLSFSLVPRRSTSLWMSMMCTTF